MGAPIGNKNATKKKRKNAVLIIRCTPQQKRNWKKAAKGHQGGLTGWVIARLESST
jgi:hypothetical protein